MFPDFNIYSTPLFVLVFQGLILSILLLLKSKINISYFFLGILLLITSYHRTTYTVGFMGWYDTFRNTKINYYLISLGLATGPLIYYYIKSVSFKDFKFKKKDLLHFIPALIYILVKLFIFAYDSTQAGFDQTQNGPAMQYMMENTNVVLSTLFTIHLLVYLILSFRLYFKFRKILENQFSNTYKLQLKWLMLFLICFSFLFIYNTLQMITEGFILDLHWTQEWWYQFFSVVIVIYLGVKGYFTPTENIAQLDISIPQFQAIKESKPKEIFEQKEALDALLQLVEKEQLYLDPNLSLQKLSRQSKIQIGQLSYIINKGTGQNFNDFINAYRVKDITKKLKSEKYNHLSILAIALDAGFNSKATFNRVFKRLTGKSPSDFRK